MEIPRPTSTVSALSLQFFKKAAHAAALHYPKVFLIVLLVLLLLPLVLFDFAKPAFTEFDRNYWGRKELTAAFSSFRYHILGEKIYDLAVTGESNWLMYTGEFSLDDYQRTKPLTQDQLLLMQQRLDSLEAYLHSQSIRLVVVIVPNKNTIYPEKMPKTIPILGEQSRLDQLLDYMDAHGRVKLLDLRPAMLAVKPERMVYYPTDTHWNPHGAFIAYQQILNALEPDFPLIKPYSLDDFEFVPEPAAEGDLSVLTQTRVEDALYSLKPRFQTEFSIRKMTDASGVNYIYSAHPNQALPRMVMYHDSFSLWLYPILSNHFSRGVYIWSPHVDKAFIAEEDPDIVVVEIAERYLEHIYNLPAE